MGPHSYFADPALFLNAHPDPDAYRDPALRNCNVTFEEFAVIDPISTDNWVSDPIFN